MSAPACGRFRSSDHVSPLIGRETELAALRALWDEGARFLTITGSLGSGKSALAKAFVEGRSAVRHVDLMAALTERDVLTSVARALGNADADEAWSIEKLSDEPALLVFDPVERVVEPVRELLVRWFLEIPTLRAICVSREPLGHEDERAVSVPPLAEDAAAAVFVHVANMDRASSEELARVRGITRRLGGLPLSIVLAARRTDLLSLGELDARLNAPLAVLKGGDTEHSAAHPSLRVAIQWSWESLNQSEQEFLKLVSPAEFGFRFDVAEALTKRTEAALDALDALTRKHLVFASGGNDARRFHVMSAVRDFAREQIATEGARRRTQQAFALATLTANEQRGDDPNERDTLLALANDWLDGEPQLSARALLAAHASAFLRGPFEIYGALLTRAIAAAPSAAVAARLELALGELKRERGDLRGANEILASARSRVKGADDSTLSADITRLLGVIARMEGDTTLARSLIDAALPIYKTANDERRQALAFGDLGAIQLASGQLIDARESLRRVVEIHRRRGDQKALGPALSYLGIATHRLGYFVEAITLHEEAQSSHEALGHVRYLAAEATHLGYCHHEVGNFDAATAHFERAIPHAEAAHDALLLSVALLYAARVDTERSAFDAAAEKLARALAGTQEIAHARLEASVLTALGHLSLARNDIQTARALYDRALARSLASETGFELLTPGYLALTRSKLGQSEAASAKLAECVRATAAHESPLVREAARFLEMVVRGEDVSKNRAASSEGRWIQRLGKSATPTVSLAISSDGERIVLTGEPFDMKRRGALRRILVALVDHRRKGPPSALDWKQLSEAGWPGEKMRTDAAIKRVYTAVWTLRKMGLGEYLVTRDDGYFLSEALEIRDL